MRHRTMRWAVLLLCVLVLAACGGGTSQTGGPTTHSTLTPTPLPSAGTVSATISGLGSNGEPGGYLIAADDTAIWVHNSQTGTLLRIDPKTNTIVATITVGGGAGKIAIGQGAVWVVAPNEGKVLRIDPQTNQVVAAIQVNTNEQVGYDITVSPGAVWLTDFINDTLIRIDPATNQIAAKLPNYPGIIGISSGAGSVWACNRHSTDQGLVRVDPQTNQMQAQINPAGDQGYCSSVVALDQTVWTMSFFTEERQSTRVERIDPATNRVSAIVPVPDAFPGQLAADVQGAWVFDPDVGLYRIDPTTNRLIGLLTLQGANGVGVGAGSVWVAKSDGTLLRITPAS